MNLAQVFLVSKQVLFDKYFKLMNVLKGICKYTLKNKYFFDFDEENILMRVISKLRKAVLHYNIDFGLKLATAKLRILQRDSLWLRTEFHISQISVHSA